MDTKQKEEGVLKDVFSRLQKMSKKEFLIYISIIGFYMHFLHEKMQHDYILDNVKLEYAQHVDRIESVEDIIIIKALIHALNDSALSENDIKTLKEMSVIKLNEKIIDLFSYKINNAKTVDEIKQILTDLNFLINNRLISRPERDYLSDKIQSRLNEIKANLPIKNRSA